MKKLLRLASAIAVSASLATGVAAAQTGGSIDTTGPNSTNKIETKNHTSLHLDNHNDVNLDNHNGQHASSGDAKVFNNTTGGSATSGNASNSNSLNAGVHISNTASAGMVGDLSGMGGTGGGSISTTGPDSYNKVETHNDMHVNVDNHNDVNLDNHNWQSATTGDAKVFDNTTGGSATTGDATNTNSATFDVNISN